MKPNSQRELFDYGPRASPSAKPTTINNVDTLLAFVARVGENLSVSRHAKNLCEPKGIVELIYLELFRKITPTTSERPTIFLFFSVIYLSISALFNY